MPNWVFNTLDVKANRTPDQDIVLQAFRDAVVTSDGKVFGFQPVVPMPECLRGTTSPSAVKGLPTWYDWALEHWGTKWDADGPAMTCRSRRHLVYGFQTAWSEPEAAVLAMSALFPTLGFTLRYHEETGIKGGLLARAGTVVAYQGASRPKTRT